MSRFCIIKMAFPLVYSLCIFWFHAHMVRSYPTLYRWCDDVAVGFVNAVVFGSHRNVFNPTLIWVLYIAATPIMAK